MYRLTSMLRTLAAASLLAALTPAVASAQVDLLSDQPIYAPGANAQLTGTGFLPAEVVTLQVLPADGSPATGPEHDPWTVVADASGDFATAWTVCDDACIGMLLRATASGPGSGSSDTFFFNHDCGDGVVTSVTPVGGACSEFNPANGGGPDNYEVVQGGTYVMTIAGVTECTGSTITVFVQSSSTGNFCFNATGGGGTYVGTFTMPNPACNTMPVSYKCGANADCSHPGSFSAQGPTSGCGGVHLRASNFDGNCNKTSTDTDCSGGCVPCTLTCPPDVQIDCSDSTDPSNTGTPTGCSAATYSDTTTAGNCPGNYVITRHWSADDTCGGTATCDQTITVTDSTGPDITCPADVALDCSDPSDPGSTGSATAIDDCSGVASISFNDSTAAGSCAGNYVITRTWTATDNCGNASSCDQTLTVSDTTGPDITCPADVALDCSDPSDPGSTGSATAIDDCSGVASISFNDSTAAGSCAGNYVITRTWTAIDNCGNASSCDQTLTVTDTTGPDITCPANVMIDCSDSTDPADTGSATATDDCSGVASITFGDAITPGNCAGNYIITRTWTATDGCGNTSSCEQVITVTDTTAPEITCPPDIEFVGCCLTPDIGQATAVDDCSDVTVTSDAPGSFCLGETIVTWTATDECGNESSCQQTVTVVPVCLGFETDGNGAPLLHGQNLVTVGPEAPFACLTITSGSDPVTPGNGNNGAAIFDSTNGPFGQDPDLNVGLGNILIVQANSGTANDFTGANGFDTWDHPNDDEDGGTLTLDFCTAVELLSIDVIDIELPAPAQDASFVLTDGNGFTRTYTVPSGWTDNGPGAGAVGSLDLNAVVPQPGFSAVATVATDAGFDETNIVQLKIRFGSSGAIDNLKYCPSAPAASVAVRNGTGVNPNVFTPASMPIIGAPWAATLDCGAYGSGVAIMTVRLAPAGNDMSPFGEVLIGGDLLHTATRAYSASASRLTWNIPFDMSLCGVEVYVQGLCQQSGAPATGSKIRYNKARLTNALDLTLGF